MPHGSALGWPRKALTSFGRPFRTREFVMICKTLDQRHPDQYHSDIALQAWLRWLICIQLIFGMYANLPSSVAIMHLPFLPDIDTSFMLTLHLPYNVGKFFTDPAHTLDTKCLHFRRIGSLIALLMTLATLRRLQCHRLSHDDPLKRPSAFYPLQAPPLLLIQV